MADRDWEKTTYASRMFQPGLSLSQAGSNYYTQGIHSLKLLLALYKRFGMGEYIPYGTQMTFYNVFIVPGRFTQDTIIVVDEIDYAF